jgi:hypothetical protein
MASKQSFDSSNPTVRKRLAAAGAVGGLLAVVTGTLLDAAEVFSSSSLAQLMGLLSSFLSQLLGLQSSFLDVLVALVVTDRGRLMWSGLPVKVVLLFSSLLEEKARLVPSQPLVLGKHAGPVSASVGVAVARRSLRRR